MTMFIKSFFPISDKNKLVRFQALLMAQIPSSTYVTASTVYMKWDFTLDDGGDTYFEIKYRDILKEHRYNCKRTVENEITLNNLKSDTEYEMKGFVVTNEGGTKQIFYRVFMTKHSFLQDLAKASEQIGQIVYQLPCHVYDLEKGSLRDCHLRKSHINIVNSCFA